MSDSARSQWMGQQMAVDTGEGRVLIRAEKYGDEAPVITLRATDPICVWSIADAVIVAAYLLRSVIASPALRLLAHWRH